MIIPKPKLDITGLKFNRLTAIEIDIERYNKDLENNKLKGILKLPFIYWWCECECKRVTSVTYYQLKRTDGKETRSCGCLKHESTCEYNKTKKKYNNYNLEGDFGIGYSFITNEEFYFDIEDYDLIKDYCWNFNKDNYIVTAKEKKTIYMHKLIVNVKDVVDHINRKPFDNRKDNLRISTSQQNNYNSSLAKNNTSGVTGVHWHKFNKKWTAYIRKDKVNFLGNYLNKDDAIKARLKAEKELFGEYAPQQHLYEQYGIK